MQSSRDTLQLKKNLLLLWTLSIKPDILFRVVKNIIIAVDHKPLLGTFTDRSLNKIPNNRLRNLKQRTLRYRFTMIHVPGCHNWMPDGLSRHPTGTPTPKKMPLSNDISAISGFIRLHGIWSRLVKSRSQKVTRKWELLTTSSVLGFQRQAQRFLFICVNIISTTLPQLLELQCTKSGL